MSKSTLAKIAALACSAATLGVLGITAAAAATEKPIDETKLDATKTSIVAGQIEEAEAGEVVKFPVYIYNNKGYGPAGLRVNFEKNGVTPNLNAAGKLVTKKGDAGDDVTVVFSYNLEPDDGSLPMVGLGTMGADGEFDSGLMFTVEMKVPENAEPGTTYPMTLEIERWLDLDTQPINPVLVNGYIKVKEPPVATTTTTTTSTTTTTTTTTTTSSTTPTTTTTTSTTPVVTTSTTPATTSSTKATTTTSGKTTTGKTTTTGKASTTTATKSSGTGTTANKTGDAGVGVAVAGLMIAAGTAVVATKKKKED